MEVFESGKNENSQYKSFGDGSFKVLITGGPSREAWMSVGIVGALLYACMQGMLDVGLKVGYEKVNLQVYQILLP